MRRPESGAEPRLRLVGPDDTAETLRGREKGAERREGADRDSADAARSALLALIGRLRPDLSAEDALMEVEATLADFDARCEAVDLVVIEPVTRLDQVADRANRPRVRAVVGSLGAFLLLVGSPLGGTVGVIAAGLVS